MRPLLTYIFVGLSLGLALPRMASAEPRLLSVGYESFGERTLVHLRLSEPAQATLLQDGRRLELVVPQTAAPDTHGDVEHDDKEILDLDVRRDEERATRVVLRLRRAPMSVTLEPSAPSRSLTLTLVRGQALGGAPLDPKARRPVSAFAGNWRAMVRHYTTAMAPLPLSLRLPPVYSLVPPGKPGPGEVLAQTLAALAAGELEAAARMLHEHPGDSNDPSWMLAQAELAARQGDGGGVEAAMQRLRPVLGPERSLTLETYLKRFVLAQIDPYGARRMQAANPKLLPEAAWALQDAGLALATGGDTEQALSLLPAAINAPAPLTTEVERLRADLWARLGRSPLALALYRQHGRSSGIESRLLQATAMIDGGDPEQARALLVATRRLPLSADQKGRAGLLLAQTALLKPEWETAKDYLDQAVKDDPHGPFGTRARIRLADIRLLRGPVIAEELLPLYEEIAKAPEREVREEARLKQAIALHLGGEDEAALAALETFLREFAAGPLAGEGQALLADVLPEVLLDRLREQRDVAALSLLDRHRDLLLATPLSAELIDAIADGFERLGLPQRGEQVYAYLLQNDRRPETIERAAPHLWRAYMAMQQWGEASAAAKLYLQARPKGELRSEALQVQAKALAATGHEKEALAAAEKAGDEGGPLLETLQAELLMDAGRHREALSHLPQTDETTSAYLRLLRAVCLEHVGETALAEKAWASLVEIDAWPALAHYRLGDLAEARQDWSKALQHFEALADKGGDVLWQSLATLRLPALKAMVDAEKRAKELADAY